MYCVVVFVQRSVETNGFQKQARGAAMLQLGAELKCPVRKDIAFAVSACE